MNEILNLFPQKFWTEMLPLFLVGYAAMGMPFWVSLFHAFPNRYNLRKRLFYILLVPSLIYGSMLLFWVLVVLPLDAFFLFVFPVLEESNASRPTWLAYIYKGFTEVNFLISLAYVVFGSFFLSRYFARRWNAMLQSFA